jgi:hypothetical protein
MLPCAGLAQTVTLDFDAPAFALGSQVGQVDDITFRPSATVFTPARVVTFSGTQALKVPTICATPQCTNNAYRMEIRFGQPLPAPAGAWLWKRADSVSIRIGADAIATSCFPEGTNCAMYARLTGFNDQDQPVATSSDLLLLDTSSLSTGGFSAPITRQISIGDPRASIVRVVLVYGKDTAHDANPPFPGEPQIDHLVVNFPAVPPTPPPTPAAPSISINEPVAGPPRNFPYQLRLRGTVTVPGALAAFCYRVNAPTPGLNDCRNIADLRPDDTFDISIPDGILSGVSNTLSVTVYDFWGQRGTQSVSIQALAPPPPAIIVYTPTGNQWIDPAQTISLSGTVGTVGALKGFCIHIDAAADPDPAACTQDMSAIKSTNTAWQPLFFTKSLTPNTLNTGAHRISVFAVDRWSQMSRADIDISTPTDFRVVGMEITQGIQTLDIPLNTTGYAPYNGVNLRSGVPTVVRVFANTPFAGSYAGFRMLLNGFIPDSRYGESPLGSLLPDSSPTAITIGSLGVPPSMRADPSSAFVFTLPTDWTQGNGLRLQAKLLPPFGALECPTCTANNEFSVVGINFGPAISFKIASVALTFTDATGSLNSPPDPSVVFEPMLNFLPTPASNVTVLPYAGTIDVSDLVGPKGFDGMTALCRNWTSICQARIYSRMRIWESQHPQDADWVGLGPIDIGWTVAPIAIANSGLPIIAAAHELFHDLGYFHASGACDADLFIMWPPDERGLIHGVGLDRRKNLLNSSGVWTGRYNILMNGMPGGPAEYFDLMSYCASENTAWISVENWNVFGGPFPNGWFPYLDLFSGTISGPMTGSSSAPLKTAPPNTAVTKEAIGNTVMATALLEPSGTVQLLSIAPVPNKRLKTPAQSQISDDYAFVARNPQGVESARVPAIIQINTGHHESGQPARQFLFARIAARDAASIEIQHKGQTVAKRLRSKSAPSVRFALAKKGVSLSRAESLDLKWIAADRDGNALEVQIAFSEREDKPFRPIFMGPNRGSWKIPGRLLSATEHGRLRITVNDGFNETEEVFAPIVVNAAPPAFGAISPKSGTAFPDSTPIRLRAEAFGDGDARLSNDQIQWSLDGKIVGTGQEVEVRNLTPANHIARVTATEGTLTSSREIAFIVSKSTPESGAESGAKKD